VKRVKLLKVVKKGEAGEGGEAQNVLQTGIETNYNPHEILPSAPLLKLAGSPLGASAIGSACWF
jgi:hypothetical protein